jgi:hypothetical protein
LLYGLRLRADTLGEMNDEDEVPDLDGATAELARGESLKWWIALAFATVGIPELAHLLGWY